MTARSRFTPELSVDIYGPYNEGQWVWRTGYKVMTDAAKPKYKKLTHRKIGSEAPSF